MNKIKLIIATFTFAFLTTFASAKSYVGVDINSLDVKFDEDDTGELDSFSGFGLHYGYEFNKMFALEASYQMYGSDDTSAKVDLGSGDYVNESIEHEWSSLNLDLLVKYEVVKNLNV